MKHARVAAVVLVALSTSTARADVAADAAAAHKEAVKPKPDVLVFMNGDTLSGKFLREVNGQVSFHSDVLGDVTVTWDKVRELRSAQKLVVLETNPGVHTRHLKAAASSTGIHVEDQKVEVAPESLPGSQPSTPVQATTVSATAPIPVKSVRYILDQATYERQLTHGPGPLAGWNGTVSAGGTIVEATEKQYTYTSSVALSRSVPTVPWLATRNRTTLDFSSSFGKIIQPGYESAGVFIPTSYTKSDIYHADAERDQYLSLRIYGLGQVAFDHNYAQGLDLQQIYGSGLGWTTIKRPKSQLDLKATLQYEKQEFISEPINGITPAGVSQNLVGSTLATTYLLKLPRNVVFNQQLAYLPAFNVGRAYSATETDSIAVPFYKSLSFTVGTNDSYLNDPPPTEPPSTRNSFQFTTGITYNLHSRY